MPRALPADLRQTIVERHLAGGTLSAIASELALSVWSVRAIWRRSRDHGASGLTPGYVAGGRVGPRLPATVYAAALALRQAHPGWGAGLIRVELAQACPDQPLPHAATLRRWFRQAGLTAPPRSAWPPDPPRSQQPPPALATRRQRADRLGRRPTGELAGGQRRGDRSDARGRRFPPGPVDAGRSA